MNEHQRIGDKESVQIDRIEEGVCVGMQVVVDWWRSFGPWMTLNLALALRIPNVMLIGLINLVQIDQLVRFFNLYFCEPHKKLRIFNLKNILTHLNL